MMVCNGVLLIEQAIFIISVDNNNNLVLCLSKKDIIFLWHLTYMLR